VTKLAPAARLGLLNDEEVLPENGTLQRVCGRKIQQVQEQKGAAFSR